MIAHDKVEGAIIQNRPGEPFVLRNAEAEIDSLDSLDWQANTEPPTWSEVTAWVAELPAQPADVRLADQTRASIVRQNLEDSGVTQGDLPAKYQDLLAKAKAGIPWFEAFVGGKHPTDAELGAALAAFSALPQSTKDRVLFNCVRTLAAIMRYNTGDL